MRVLVRTESYFDSNTSRRFHNLLPRLVVQFDSLGQTTPALICFELVGNQNSASRMERGTGFHVSEKTVHGCCKFAKGAKQGHIDGHDDKSIDRGMQVIHWTRASAASDCTG